MEIAKNKTTLTKKMLVAFQNREVFMKSWVIALCAIALIIVSFRIVDGRIVLNSIPFLVIGCVAYPVYIGIVKLLFYKQNKTFIPVTIEYTFTETVIKLDGVSELGRETTEIPYSSLSRVRITKKYTFLYLNKTSALVLDNSCFSVGSIEKLRALLSYKFPEKLSTLSKKNTNVEEEKDTTTPSDSINKKKTDTIHENNPENETNILKENQETVETNQEKKQENQEENINEDKTSDNKGLNEW